jgi:hypothetical protein
LNIAIAALTIIAVASISPKASVSDFEFGLICVVPFVLFMVLPFLAGMTLLKSLLWAAICTFLALIAGVVASIAIHGIGPCL